MPSVETDSPLRVFDWGYCALLPAEFARSPPEAAAFLASSLDIVGSFAQQPAAAGLNHRHLLHALCRKAAEAAQAEAEQPAGAARGFLLAACWLAPGAVAAIPVVSTILCVCAAPIPWQLCGQNAPAAVAVVVAAVAAAVGCGIGGIGCLLRLAAAAAGHTAYRPNKSVCVSSSSHFASISGWQCSATCVWLTWPSINALELTH